MNIRYRKGRYIVEKDNGACLSFTREELNRLAAQIRGLFMQEAMEKRAKEKEYERT